MQTADISIFVKKRAGFDFRLIEEVDRTLA
jgi:hypothetical protein